MRQLNVTIDNELHEWLSRLAAIGETTRPQAVLLILRDARQRHVKITPAGLVEADSTFSQNRKDTR